MTGTIGGAPRPAAIQTVTQFGRFRALPVVDHEVDRHLAFQAADIPMAEIVAQFVNLEHEKERTFVSREPREPIRSRFDGERRFCFPKDTFQRHAAD